MGEQTTPGLDLAIGHLRSGRPAETAAICRARLAADPADFEAWHLLGVARTMLGETRP
jgi:cytochrome c-type biogenesis protein CcmH/NrfG